MPTLQTLAELEADRLVVLAVNVREPLSRVRRYVESAALNLPVLRDQRLAGVISIGDVVKCQIAEAAHEAESLRTYIAAG